MTEQIREVFPSSCNRLPADFWEAIRLPDDPEEATRSFPGQVAAWVGQQDRPTFLADLARIEYTWYRLGQKTGIPGTAPDVVTINPALELVPVDWQPLLPLLDGKSATPHVESVVLAFWQHPVSGEHRKAVASAADLLAVKVILEERDPLQVALETGKPVGVIDAALEQAIFKGLLLAPPSRLQRSVGGRSSQAVAAAVQRAEVFTLQWHITHRCDLHCKHCYDRSRRQDVSLPQGLDILDQMRRFCLANHVGGQVSFSGGNPFLHPDFGALYQAACDRNLTPAILGNPVSEKQLDDILQIAAPSFYQVSLEGLREHNDQIRGQGNFDSVIAFLERLQAKNIYSMVMLTLTRANLDQVLPLAEFLRGRTNLFTYNRLAMVGEGASLASPGRDEYREFVRSYLNARQSNPTMALKDSLLNIELEHRPDGTFGGCTGFGCGAAFNFVSLLPDGQVHACRKFPSPIGDINRQSLEEIYASERARAIRRGCSGCDDCRLRPVCGGCLAVAYGFGVDPLKVRDPACFFED